MSVELVVAIVVILTVILAGAGYGYYRYRQNQLLLGEGVFAPLAVSDVDFFHSATYFTSSYWTDHYWTIAGAGVPPAPTAPTDDLFYMAYIIRKKRYH